MYFELTSQLKKVRLERGITQERLYELTGIAVSQISQFENDKTFPNIYTLWRISKALECNVDDLYREK